MEENFDFYSFDNRLLIITNRFFCSKTQNPTVELRRKNTSSNNFILLIRIVLMYAVDTSLVQDHRLYGGLAHKK